MRAVVAGLALGMLASISGLGATGAAGATGSVEPATAARGAFPFGWAPARLTATPRDQVLASLRAAAYDRMGRNGDRRRQGAPPTSQRRAVGQAAASSVKPGGRGRRGLGRLLSSAGPGFQPLGPSRADALTWQGWPTNVMPSVGYLAIGYPAANGSCTATVVSRTLLLTAAHCIWDRTQGGYAKELVFVPGMTWRDARNKLSINTDRYGIWSASNWWVPDGFRSGDMAYDYALIEIPPATNGDISDFTGAWAIQTGIRWGSGARTYVVGYPQAGFWSTAEGYHGRGQYACDATYDQQYQSIGSGYELWSACTMNRGASGGPWFVLLNSGRWMVGSVNSQCFGTDMSVKNYCNPYSQYMRGPYLDARFVEFWNNVQAQLEHR